ncbi:hypothetical protein [Halocalculus aciditolerans]|uniref:Uncharacterized protein n=1 Tax=Halocalculus aciditolerans TaxID=1383812 RepID=A0A830FK23_9EURY|nr:hypothetical protein [Halocalculus aciditolerans]GGL54338.1 hypothetical protein GCM10009039_10630 [Halocalculus aciditolerans]
MGLWLDVVRAASALNVIVLLALCAVWVRNYWQFRSKHALGLSVFGVLLLAENALGFYFFTIDEVRAAWFSSAVPPVAGTALMVLPVLELAALAFLAWVTLD